MADVAGHDVGVCSELNGKHESKLLDGLGFKVVGTATNGKERVDAYKVCLPDVVTMGISMPIMDGIKATPAIEQ